MADDLVKRQHFVPRTYLNKFSRQSGEDYYIWAVKKTEPKAENIFETNIINVCAETHLYTLPGDTVREKMIIEKFYSSQIEAHYDTFYKLLTDPNKTEVTPEERDLIITTVVTMFYRTTKWINQHNELMRRVYTQAFENCKQMGKDSFKMEGVSISIAGKTLDQFVNENKIENKPAQVMTQLDVAFKLIELRKANDGIFVVKLNENDCEFITSDNPVLIQNTKGRVMPFDPTNTMKIPLDKKHMLLLMPYANEADKKYLVRHNVKGDSCYTKKLTSTTEQFESSERFILGEKSSLLGYLKTKELAEKPLSAEELKGLTSFEDIIKKAKDLGLI